MTASLRFPSRTARRILVAALIAPLIAPATDAVAQRTHEHGAARLDVSVDAQTLTIRLESPLDNLVGFESAPKSEQQRTTVRRMAERFHRPQDLFQPTAAAACTPGSVSLASLAIPAALLAAPGAPVPAADPLPAVAGKGMPISRSTSPSAAPGRRPSTAWRSGSSTRFRSCAGSTPASSRRRDRAARGCPADAAR